MWQHFKSLKLNFANLLAFYVITLCMIWFFYVSSSHFPPELLKEVSDIKIALIGVTTLILGYYFGSSKSSKDKDDSIKELAAKNEAK